VEELLEATTQRSTSGEARPARLRALAFWDGGSAWVDLEPGTSLSIGRGEGSGLRIVHPSVSRNHALLERGECIEVEDLGSANGTRLDGRVLGAHERVVLRVGMLLEIGDAVVSLRGDDAEPGLATAAPSVGRNMGEVVALVDRVALGNIPVTLVGETGVGKEILAERLHARSPRARAPFVRINCAAVPEQLLESELFGHERGAFTGAVQAKAGLLESGSGGTVFLDEVGELPPLVQAKLLRSLECRELLRVGSLRPRPFDVRFVAATNRDLDAMVSTGDFRADLFHRLCGVVISVPPLRERLDEIPALAHEFLSQAAGEVGRPTPGLSGEALARLTAYGWPGNVRELRHVMHCALLVCDSNEVTLRHLPHKVAAAKKAPLPGPETGSLRSELAEIERQRIVAALDRAGGNQTEAAKLLGMPRRTLIARIEALRLPRPRKKPRLGEP
jgi:two-component system response regulator AtoC